MVKIQVTGAPIETRSGIGKTSGKPYTMRTQTGYLWTVDKNGVLAEFPEKFPISLEDNQAPYVPGNYTFADNAFYVDAKNFGRIVVTPSRLVPIKG